MSRYAIRTEGISKSYKISAREPYRALRDVLARWAWPPRVDSEVETLWALQDISIEIRPGEVVGIIGRNGAGKSTLLKILSRITEPTAGVATVFGRISSMLEVGTGFHPELTGRENVYLNGTILGMRKTEIDRRFEEIVAFAEVQKFLDTPVKHYSSGMQMRLAFAVAAHLEPEILLIDEVLAVGDARFQRKCVKRMEEIGTSGHTVVYVSHNMPSITRLCQRTILLDGGRVIADGPSPEVVSVYLNAGVGTTGGRQWSDPKNAPGDSVVRLVSVSACTEDGISADSFDIRRRIGIRTEYEVLAEGHVLVPNLHFFNEEGVCLFVTLDSDPKWKRRARPAGHFLSTAWVPGNLLAEGTIVVGVAISTLNPFIVHFDERDAVAFHVIDNIDGDAARGDFAGRMPGVMRPMLDWTTLYSSVEKQEPPIHDGSISRQDGSDAY
jgi:lipopolysaccharide transport system ATP-binding protein